MRKSIVWTGIATVSLSTLLTVGCGDKQPVVAKIGGESITLKNLNDRILTFPAQYQEALKQKENKAKILDQMIDEKAVEIAAKEKGYDKKDEFKTQIEDARRQLLITTFVKEEIDKSSVVNDQDIQAYYEKNTNQFKAATQRRIRHIVVKTEAEANGILTTLKGGAEFGALARQKSIDQTAAAGGEAGWVSPGQLVPEFDHAIFAIAAVGQLSGVVKTKLGFHVIQVEEERLRPEIPFDQVKDQIRSVVQNEKKQAKTLEVLKGIKAKLKIVRNIDKIS